MPKPKAIARPSPAFRIASEPTKTRMNVPMTSAVYFCQLFIGSTSG
jgi:hypothetical protein